VEQMMPAAIAVARGLIDWGSPGLVTKVAGMV
jgi:hypothetical protein